MPTKSFKVSIKNLAVVGHDHKEPTILRLLYPGENSKNTVIMLRFASEQAAREAIKRIRAALILREQG